MIEPPHNISELIKRVNEIAGCTILELADRYKQSLPTTLKLQKGSIGQLLEYILGANAGSQSLPDFVDLNIELKSIPVDQNGKPLESTFICMVPTLHSVGLQWENSIVKQKLTNVLWIPILCYKGRSYSDRIIGQGFLWQPNVDEENIIKNDWEELMEMIILGQFENLTAKLGNVLQIRPKALNASIRTTGYDENGHLSKVSPRGFYLRPSFTASIIRDYLIVS